MAMCFCMGKQPGCICEARNVCNCSCTCGCPDKEEALKFYSLVDEQVNEEEVQTLPPFMRDLKYGFL